MKSKAATVEQYLAALPDERREIVEALCAVIRADIDGPFEEGVQHGAPSYFLPHSVYPAGYHRDPRQPLPFASIASRKKHVVLYLFCIYTCTDEEERLREEWLRSGKKLDMGRSCVRIKKLEDVPLEVVGRAFERMTAGRFIAAYEAGLAAASSRRRARGGG